MIPRSSTARKMCGHLDIRCQRNSHLQHNVRELGAFSALPINPSALPPPNFHP